MSKRSSASRLLDALDWRLWVVWVVASVIGSGMLGVEAALASSLPDGTPITAWMFAVPSVPALFVGLVQWIILRWRLHLPAALVVVWLCGSVIGMGTLTIFFSSFAWEGALQPVDAYWGDAFYAGVFGAIAGCVQCSVLLGRIKWAPTWIVISTVGGLIGWPLACYIGDSLLGRTNGLVMGYLGIGALTGFALALLVRVTLREHGNQPDPDLA